MNQSSRKDRIMYLDSLRGFAAIWVVLVHIAMMPQPNFLLPDWFGIYIKSGTMGVELFFVVSAFSLCISMPGHKRERYPLLGFALRRFFRIAPLFYLLILFTAFFNPAGFTYNLKSIAANIFFIFNFIPGHGYQTSVVLAGWTIGVEMIFYLLFPFLYARITNVWLAISGAFAAIVLSYIYISVLPFFVKDWQMYNMYSFFYRLPIFMFGLVAFFSLPKLKQLPDSRYIGGTLLCAAAVMFYAIVNQKVPFFDPYHWNGVMFACVVIGMELFPFRLAVNAKTAWLGKISYSVYLVHSPIIALLFPFYKQLQKLGWESVTTYTTAIAVTLAIVIPVAALSYYILEAPANNFGRKLADKYAQRDSVPASQSLWESQGA